MHLKRLYFIIINAGVCPFQSKVEHQTEQNRTNQSVLIPRLLNRGLQLNDAHIALLGLTVAKFKRSENFYRELLSRNQFSTMDIHLFRVKLYWG